MKKINLIILSLMLTLILITGCTSKQTTEHSHAEGEYYTCPMHSTIVQDEEGDCPICGMDLVLEKGKSTQTMDNSNNTERKIKYWVAPMDANYISNEPGKSPMGMDLVPVYEDEVTSGKSISIDPTVVQNMGVRVKHVSYRDISHSIRTIGKVKIADDKSYAVNLRFSGWIEKIYADKVGQKIVKGAKLFEIYSPELIAAQEEYLLAVNTYGKESKIAEASQKRLLLWNIPQNHLAKIISENVGSAEYLFWIFGI